jgi:hypothetical protein
MLKSGVLGGPLIFSLKVTLKLGSKISQKSPKIKNNVAQKKLGFKTFSVF